jgi:tRNA-splicing ligase RtcB
LIGSSPLAKIENHHNFAWKEMVNGKECIVHRKGATPAKMNELGIIPGSMTAPGYIVRGRGNKESLQSASHGAGRKHSRTKCKEKFTQSDIKHQLKMNDVSLIGGGIDEAPMAYKDIRKVIANQQELIEVLGTFTPKIVRMDK